MHHPHHQQIRKRIHKKHEKFPHPEPLKRLVDHLVYGVGIFIPFMTFLQSYKIWSTQNAEGISFVTFAGYASANLVWLMYAILHKEKPLIMMYTLSIIFNTSIAVGVIMYG